ncbi:MAG: FUSC family protein [Cyanobium sp. ELA712]
MGSSFQGLRLVATVGLASGITWALCHALGFWEATPYGVVIAAVMVRPRFDRWPREVYALLPVVVMVGLSLGTLLKPLLEGPQVWQFAIVSGLALTLGQALPDKLAIVRNLITVAAVLPLLASNSTWLGAWHQTLAVVVGLIVAPLLQAGLRLPVDRILLASEGESEPAESLLAPRSLRERFADVYFWRKLVVAMLAMAIGVGVGAVTPKYLFFGVVLLLNDSLGATLGRVRDRMVGVSLGVLMPWLVFNTMGIQSVAVMLVMGGTTALIVALGLIPQLRTALISSGVTFVGYGALTDWYIPNRWIDYLMGCLLALIVCLVVRPLSALSRFRQLALAGEGMTAELSSLLPSALEEARALGQEPELRELIAALSLRPEDPSLDRRSGGRSPA